MAVNRQVYKFKGKDRARFNKVNAALVSLKNRNAKVPALNILTVDQVTKVNDLIAAMNALLALKINV